jgi:hypothetical protein
MQAIESNLEPLYQPKRGRLQPYTIEELQHLPKRTPLIKGYLDAGGMSVMYGESNCGKSFLALDMAMHISLGDAWNGKRVKQGEVVYIAAEGGMGIVERIQAYMQHNQITEAPGLYLIPSGIDLCSAEADTQEIIKECHKIDDVKLVVIDTLARALAGGNENAPDDMGAVIRHCDRIRQATGAHILIIHHAGKDTSKGGRGHSSLRAAVDTELEVVKDSGGTVSLEIKKQRDGKTGDILSFTLEQVKLGMDEDGDPITSCVAVPAEYKFQLAGKAKDVYEILTNLIAENGDVTLDDWRDAVTSNFTDDGMKRDTIRQTFSRAKKQLEKHKIITTYKNQIRIA